MIFRDRIHAGEALAEHLEAYRGKDAVVLGLARGGVPVAAQIASKLGLPLDVLVIRKLGVPGNEEFAFGAIGPGGVAYVDKEVVGQLGLTSEQIDEVVEKERQELKRRLERYLGEESPLEVEGRVALVVDDGIATGSTLRAAIKTLEARRPARIVVAAPVAPPETVSEFKQLADEVVCVSSPRSLSSIGQWYELFDQTSDEEVLELRREYGPRSTHSS